MGGGTAASWYCCSCITKAASSCGGSGGGRVPPFPAPRSPPVVLCPAAPVSEGVCTSILASWELSRSGFATVSPRLVS